MPDFHPRQKTLGPNELILHRYWAPSAKTPSSGQSMVDLGIFNNDIVVVSRGRRPRDGHIVVATVDGEFTVKQLYKKFGRIKLKAANPTFPDIVPKDGQTIAVWGVVTGAIKIFPV